MSEEKVSVGAASDEAGRGILPFARRSSIESKNGGKVNVAKEIGENRNS